jgi:hypothetical protein
VKNTGSRVTFEGDSDVMNVKLISDASAAIDDVY